jgi:hypothetical protein
MRKVEMKIAVIMSGYIKNYDHLLNWGGILNSLEGFDFKIFGCCYDRYVNASTWAEGVDLNNSPVLDFNFVDKFYTKIRYISEDSSDLCNENRIYKQWKNIKDGLTLCKEYEEENSLKFDLIFRSRPDINLNCSNPNELIEIFENFNNSESCDVVWYKDWEILGRNQIMTKILSLVDYYHEYHNLPCFIEKAEEHKKSENYKKSGVKFSMESENLLHYHIKNQCKINGLKFKRKHWSRIRRSYLHRSYKTYNKMLEDIEMFNSKFPKNIK